MFESGVKWIVVEVSGDHIKLTMFIGEYSHNLDDKGRMAMLPISQSNSRAFSRLMLAGAMDVEVDKQGRVVLPEYLRQFAGLKKSVVVAGLYNRVEIWDDGKWNVFKSQTEANSNEIAEKMAELGV